MAFEKNSELGEIYADRYGREVTDVDTLIHQLDTEQLANLLLSFTARKQHVATSYLWHMSGNISAMRDEQAKARKTATSDVIADARLAVLRQDIQLDRTDQTGLSVRARRGLARSGAVWLSQVNERYLRHYNGNGAKTIKELTDWAAKESARLAGSTHTRTEE